MSVLFVFRVLMVLESKEKRYVWGLLKGEVKVTGSQGLSWVLPRNHKACSMVAGLWQYLEPDTNADTPCHL